MEDKAEVYRNDSERALKALIKREIHFDYIFLDPPYKKQQLVSLVEKISEHRLVTNGGYIICEHSHDVELPERAGGFSRVKHEKYGIIAITIYSQFSEE
jgi:16S rRNA G966 N2-methylase RsmD